MCELINVTPERAALIRASHYAVAMAALMEAKAQEHDDPAAGPVYVDAVTAFDLDPEEEPIPATESRWELALAGLVAEGVNGLEAEVMRWPLSDGRAPCQLAARLTGDMTPAHLTHLLRWELQARELARVRLADGLAHCDRLAAEIDPEAALAAEVAGCGGDLLRSVRALAELIEEAGEAASPSLEAMEPLGERIDQHAQRLVDASQGLSDDAGAAAWHYAAACLGLLDRLENLLAHLEPTSPASAGAIT